MEILSDATFKGSLTIDAGSNLSKDLLVFENFSSDRTYSTPISFSFGNNIGSTGTSCVLVLDNKDVSGSLDFKVNGRIFAGCIEVTNDLWTNSVCVNFISGNDGQCLTLPASSGTLALTSQIPSLSGYLTTSAASTTYLSKTTASSTYLSKTDASSTYQKKFTTFSSPSIPANCTAFEFTGTAISDSNKTHLIQVQNTSTGKSVIAETWMTTNKKPAMSFAGCTSTVAAGTYTAIVL